MLVFGFVLYRWFEFGCFAFVCWGLGWWLICWFLRLGAVDLLVFATSGVVGCCRGVLSGWSSGLELVYFGYDGWCYVWVWGW